MKNNIYHVGYHKTGTTWFYSSFYSQCTNIVRMERLTINKIFTIKRALDFDPNIAKEEISDLGLGRYVACEELLSGNIHAGSVNGLMTKEFAYRIKQTCPEAQIVLFIRNQVDMIESAYKQYVKIGGNYGLKKYLFKDNNRRYRYRSPTFSFDNLNYLKFIDFYKELFGDENVHVFLFEEFKSDREGFFNKFNNKLDLDVDIEELDYSSVNKGYCKFILNVARFLNCFSSKAISYKYYVINIPKWDRIRKAGLRVINANLPKVFFKNKSIIPKKVKTYIEDYYKDSNKDLMNKYGLDLEKYNYPL